MKHIISLFLMVIFIILTIAALKEYYDNFTEPMVEEQNEIIWDDSLWNTFGVASIRWDNVNIYADTVVIKWANCVVLYDTVQAITGGTK